MRRTEGLVTSAWSAQAEYNRAVSATLEAIYRGERRRPSLWWRCRDRVREWLRRIY